MKKHLFSFFLCLFAVSGFSKSSVDNLSEQQIRVLLCHKWKLTTLEGKGKKMDVPSSSPEIILHFLSNGTLQEKAGNKAYNGTWTYDHSKLTVTTVDKDGTEQHTIVDISDDKLRMKTKFMGVPVIYGMQRLD